MLQTIKQMQNRGHNVCKTGDMEVNLLKEDILTILPILDSAAAYIIDLAAGDPHRLPHPVRGIGWMISGLERWLRRRAVAVMETKFKIGREKAERISGGFLAFFVALAAFMAVFALLEAAKAAHCILFHALNIFFVYSAFAARCLADEAMKVYGALAENDLPEARWLPLRRFAVPLAQYSQRILTSVR